MDIPKYKLRKYIVSTSIAWFLGLIWLIPFIGVLMASIRPYTEIVGGWWHFSPFTITLKNFVNAFNHPMFPISEGLKNSLIIAIPSTIIPLLVAALAAYAFARYSFPIKHYLFAFIIFLMALPQQMTIVPLYFLLRNLHLLNKFQGLILVHSAWGLAWIIFFMRNYFSMLPTDVEEAAKIDGASDFKIFYKIVLPMALPGLISAAILQFTWVWSDFFLALVFLQNPEKYVATQRLPLLRGQYFVDWGVLTAASIMVLLVPLLVYALFQKYYISGMIGWSTEK
ncbi:carbohydrate ABC transporter permease [Thermococcus argininiproducens]|uniref:Carbohydrate ABC transporter permease n=1 Tax=Thermococcus argininiproducens TaxID=2866384 RepID=A0A9E7SDL9_9EURY|nr:carbohydrate ABC transporter permease [Thermococcus argininiproducens]USH00762.1 carbohydrate ABC transporter permease [Thermococcus argininiproducens]